MTKEEALEEYLIESEDHNFSIEKFIHKIFDEIENRSCESCEYSIAEDGDEDGDIYRCEYLYEDIGNIMYFPNDFGCNKWEKKDD